MSAATLSFNISPFSRSLAEFDPSVRLEDLTQLREVPPPHPPLNFVSLFRHGPTHRVLAYDLLANTWSDVTDLRDWYVPQLFPARTRPDEDPYGHVLSRLR